MKVLLLAVIEQRRMVPMGFPQSSSPDSGRRSPKIGVSAPRMTPFWRLAILALLLLQCTMQRKARGDLIVQVDTVNLTSNGSMPVSGFIEVYAELTGGTTCPTSLGSISRCNFNRPQFLTGPRRALPSIPGCSLQPAVRLRPSRVLPRSQRLMV